MNLIKRSTIEQYAREHPEAAGPLADWVAMVRAAQWTTADELRRTSRFPARPIGGDRVVFKHPWKRLSADLRRGVRAPRSAEDRDSVRQVLRHPCRIRSCEREHGRVPGVMMPLAFPIRTDADLERAIALVDELWGAAPGSAEADLLEIMGTLIDRYEADRSELPAADPIELVRFKLDELGWTQRELGRRLGWSSGRVSEILGRKRPLTLAMVRSLSRELGLPAGLLVHDHREEEGVGWVGLADDVARRLVAEANHRGVTVEAMVRDALDRTSGSTNTVTFHLGTGAPRSEGRSAAPTIVGHKAAA